MVVDLDGASSVGNILTRNSVNIRELPLTSAGSAKCFRFSTMGGGPYNR